MSYEYKWDNFVLHATVSFRYEMACVRGVGAGLFVW